MSTQRQIAQELRNFKWIERRSKAQAATPSRFTLETYLRRYHRRNQINRTLSAESQSLELQSQVRRLQAFNIVLIMLLAATLCALLWVGGGHG